MNKIEYSQVVLESMHELRYFNQRLKTLSEQLTKQLNIGLIGENKPINIHAQSADHVRVVAEGILNISQLFTTRLDFIECELNPNAVEQLDIVEVNLYGKFDKAKKMINSIARNKRVKVNIKTDIEKMSLFRSYSIIDILPYLLLDNAIKYSPQDQSVSVEFIGYKDSIEIIVESFGPFVGSDELPSITDKYFRGSNAICVKNVHGKGIGLYFVKYICELHSIGLKFSSDKYSIKIDDVPYSTFTAKLSVPIK